MPFFAQINIHGDPNIGLHGFATSNYCICGGAIPSVQKKIKSILKTPVYNLKLLNTDFLSIFSVGNSSGMIVSNVVFKHEIDNIRKLGININVVDTEKAIGNLILMNDNGIVISPVLKSLKKTIEKIFGLDVVITKIAELGVVGSLGLATNKGCILSPNISEQELKKVEEALDIESDIGTVNCGSVFPGSGIIANENGFITSRLTTGPELGRITEALGFL